MTERLYYEDSKLFFFLARVTACEAGKNGFLLELDRTAFFPEGGGQPADTGFIGEARISDVHEREGRILHTADRYVAPGTELIGAVDAEQRLRRMQNHSGEHILSGVTHRLFGYDNVGFHMGAEGMTIDFSGELDEAQLRQIESMANEAVRADLPIRTWYPSSEELETLDYRSKKELAGAVRLVEIKGIDLCACCAPHVGRTGEVGMVKILSAERHRGGMRLTVICGLDALDDYRRRLESAGAVSRLLSVPQEKIAAGVERVLGEQAKLKEHAAALETELARRMAAEQAESGGNLCAFVPGEMLGEVALRELTNALADKCGGFAAVFAGSDEAGWRYIIGSRHLDLRAMSRAINAAIHGRGGGSPEMIQGRAQATEAELRAAVASF
ncbi:MAG: alanyl-tRNA editing protein [Oscillospiraceae bacterium]|nr:alanyl-tRNA editing protein [Oscillospiraceae bacterium]